MEHQTTTISSSNKQVKISRKRPTVIIGERINPTGRKKVLDALEAENFEIIRQDAIQQVDAGALVLDVNAGVPGTDEVSLLPRVLEEVMSVVDVPLCIDTSNSKALEAALKVYQGKALINSTNGEEKDLETVLPLAKQYDAAIVGLCMDKKGIPPTPKDRLIIAAKIIERADKFGIPLSNIVIDPLAMTMGSDHNAGRVTLESINLVVQEFGVNITLGASNVSFGLPDRKRINAAFLAMAIHAGLTCPVTNPLVTDLRTAVLAADLTMGKDSYASQWIKNYRKRQN